MNGMQLEKLKEYGLKEMRHCLYLFAGMTTKEYHALCLIWQGAFYVGTTDITPMLNRQLFRDMILYVKTAEKV